MRLAGKTMARFSSFWVFLALALTAGAGGAAAQEGHARPWQLGLQDAVTPIMAEIHSFHTLILWIITLITIFVLALLVFVMVRFNARSNPVPSKTTHNTAIEFAWTLIPIVILVVIAIPSFRLLYHDRTIPEADMTIKAIGNQWYWSYEYPDADGMTFDSLMVEEADLKEGQPRLLAVDNDVVVPVNKTVRVIVTATDVIHNWAIPAFGMKMDAIPGRLNEAWFRAEKTGTYYGQCSELCGQRHAFMPIAVRVVSEEDYAAWLEQAKQEFATAAPETRVARNAQ
jgi:cytochrome c oxidase subunit 2